MPTGCSGADKGDWFRREPVSEYHGEALTHEPTSRLSSDSDVVVLEPMIESDQSCVARQLCDQLLHGIHGCSEDEHESKLGKHMELVGNNHNGLSEIFNDLSFPSALGASEMMAQDHIDRDQMPSAAQWNAMFCGASHPKSDIPSLVQNVCLHKEQTQVVTPDISFDIDSFLGFATSLAIARNGLLYQAAPQARQNITTNVHSGLDILKPNEDEERPVHTSHSLLRDVPHLVLGRVSGAENIAVYVFFPHLEVALGTSILNNEQLIRWTDEILHPAIYKHCPAHFTQHLPAGYQHTLANSKANQVEARKIQSQSYQSQQAISYLLSAHHLDRIWRDVQDTILRTSGVYDFREAQIYLSAKGTKLQFKPAQTASNLLDAIENFHEYAAQALNMEYARLD